MPRTSIAERQARLDQQRARLQMEENRLKDAERKARTRRLIEAGGLVDKAGLLELDSAVLYGVLLEAAGHADNPDRIERWRLSGGRAFDREAKARDAGREPLVLTLPCPATAPLQAELRVAGFRWSKVLKHWEGLAAFESATVLAATHGGEVRRVGPAAVAATLREDALAEDLPAAAE